MQSEIKIDFDGVARLPGAIEGKIGAWFDVFLLLAIDFHVGVGRPLRDAQLQGERCFLGWGHGQTDGTFFGIFGLLRKLDGDTGGQRGSYRTGAVPVEDEAFLIL